MPLTKLEHYLVMTDDIDRTRDFYRDVIGLDVGFRADLGFPAIGFISEMFRSFTLPSGKRIRCIRTSRASR